MNPELFGSIRRANAKKDLSQKELLKDAARAASFEASKTAAEEAEKNNGMVIGKIKPVKKWVPQPENTVELPEGEEINVVPEKDRPKFLPGVKAHQEWSSGKVFDPKELEADDTDLNKKEAAA